MKKLILLLLIFLFASTVCTATGYKNKAYIFVDAKYPVNVTYQICSLDVGILVTRTGNCTTDNSVVFPKDSPALEIQKSSLEFIKVTHATIDAGPTNNAKSLLAIPNEEILHTSASSTCSGTVIILSDHADKDIHITCSAY